MESEKDTERYLKKQVKQRGGASYKWTSPNIRGVTDQICLLGNGVVLFVEVKSEGKEAEPHQLRFHEHLKDFCLEVHVVSTKLEVDLMLDSYENKVATIRRI